MPTHLESLEAEVMKLTVADRAYLLERLLARLDFDPAVEDAWQRIADQRDHELQGGVVAPIPGEEAMARLHTRLKR